MYKTALAAVALVSSLFIAGCVAPTDVTSEVTETEHEALSANKSLVGAWDADLGPIYRVTFTKDYAETLGGGLKGHRFEATLDTGIRCITTPCNSSIEVSGVYVTKGKILTLASYDKPSRDFAKYLGEYKFTVTKASLTLNKLDGTVYGKFHHGQVGEPCGNVVCGPGLECCNPVMNICVQPGMACIQ